MSGPYQFEPYRPPQDNLPAPVSYLPLTDQRPVSTALLVVSWVVVFLTGLYMLPWAVAASRGKANQWSVFAVNLLLGWTVVGWIVALVMSCTAHRPVAVPALSGYASVAALPPVPTPAGWYPNPAGPGQRYWDGRQWTQHYA
ncbi:superinfection immunity protein [Propionicimonas sp.]|uniref:superinfection immunity protein n=1 Tax=Propionicimonas sp. TaxID=1955623 RepID=UPI0039E46A64